MRSPRTPGLLAVAAGLALALGCVGLSKDADDTSDTAETAASACDRDPPLDWHNFGEGFISNHCAGCHGSLLPPGHRENAPESVNLETYEDVLVWADRVFARASGETPTMPPAGGPTADERANFEEWMICGVFPDVERWNAESGGGSEEE